VARAHAGDADRADLISIIFVIDGKARARRHRDLAAKLLTDGERVEHPELRRCGLRFATSHFCGSEIIAVLARREAYRQRQRAVEFTGVHRARIGFSVVAASKTRRVPAVGAQEHCPPSFLPSYLGPTRHLDGVVRILIF